MVRNFEELLDFILDNREKDFPELKKLVIDELEGMKPFNHGSNNFLEACGLSDNFPESNLTLMGKGEDMCKGSEIAEKLETCFSKRELAVLLVQAVRSFTAHV